MPLPFAVYATTTIIGAVGGIALWEKFVDEPEIGTVNNYGPDWKGYAVLGLAAAGGFYLASKVAK